MINLKFNYYVINQFTPTGEKWKHILHGVCFFYMFLGCCIADFVTFSHAHTNLIHAVCEATIIFLFIRSYSRSVTVLEVFFSTTFNSSHVESTRSKTD